MIDLSHWVPQLFDDIRVAMPECLEMVWGELPHGVTDSRRTDVFTTTFGALTHAIGTAIIDSAFQPVETYWNDPQLRALTRLLDPN